MSSALAFGGKGRPFLLQAASSPLLGRLAMFLPSPHRTHANMPEVPDPINPELRTQLYPRQKALKSGRLIVCIQIL